MRESPEPTPAELRDVLIPEQLSQQAIEYWNGLCGEGQNEMIIEAQRHGIREAVETLEYFAVPEITPNS